MPLSLVNDCVGRELSLVEQRFNEELTSDLPCVNALVRHVSRFLGKMLRPTLVLLAGRAAGQLNDDHITLGTVVEMVHMATLVHDDVLDEAELRRNGATINHLRGNEAAVLLGDYLISHSYHLCSGLSSQFAARAIGRTTNTVCEGELLQIHNRNKQSSRACRTCCVPACHDASRTTARCQTSSGNACGQAQTPSQEHRSSQSLPPHN